MSGNIISIEAPFSLRLTHSVGAVEFPDPFASLMRADEAAARAIEGETGESRWGRIKTALEPYSSKDAAGADLPLTLTAVFNVYATLWAWGQTLGKRFAPSATSTPSQAS